MNGSTKQIEWATTIRAQYIREVREMHARQLAAATKAGQAEQWTATMDDVIAQAEAQQSAAWWIDNRQHTSVAGRGQMFRDMYTAAVAKVQAR